MKKVKFEDVELYNCDNLQLMQKITAPAPLPNFPKGGFEEKPKIDLVDLTICEIEEDYCRTAKNLLNGVSVSLF